LDDAENGLLLDAAEAAGFELLLTTDKNIRYQQNLAGRRIAIVVLGQARWPIVRIHVARVVAAVNAAVVRISGNALTDGIEEHDVEGVRARITSPARTVVDCFKFRSKVGVDVAVEALRDYRRLRKGSADELWRQAEHLRLAKVMRPYWDGLV